MGNRMGQATPGCGTMGVASSQRRFRRGGGREVSPQRESSRQVGMLCFVTVLHIIKQAPALGCARTS
jgi:hypothetical protein